LFNDGKCFCKLYADDLKLYTILETDADITYLQEKFTNVNDWSDKWQLGLSFSKCNVKYVGRTSCNSNLCLNVNMLPVVDWVKDLGVIYLLHRPNCRNSIHPCYLDPQIFCVTWHSLFNSCFYSLCQTSTWVKSPHRVSKIMQIESVQRRFPKCLPGLKHVLYKSRLERLGL